MCGIVGYLVPLSADVPGSDLLETMAEAIRHRGPDDDGYYSAGPVGLGMRRLTIVDLANGRQPVISPDGRFIVVFNGEVFNHVELRHELSRGGWHFRTNSDSEVLLAAWATWGAECLPRLNGMFAFAVWDGAEQRLWLARDRMGVKPLYIWYDGHQLLFASEIKALMASGRCSREISVQGLWNYLTFRYVPGPGSIWANITKLPPGHLMDVKPGQAPCPRRWWDIPYQAHPRRADNGKLAAEFEALFTDAVALRMQADVPVGLMLSGGLDSSAVAAAAVESGHDRIHAFSVAFADSPGIDELPYARDVARHLGLAHHTLMISARDFMDFLPTFVRQTDEPLADLAAIPLYHLSRLAADTVKVVLSGEGADEILAGYTFDEVVASWRAQAPSRPWWRLSAPPFPDLLQVEPPPHMTNYMSSEAKRVLMPNAVDMPESMDRVREAFARCRSKDPLDRMLYAYCQDWLVEDLLMKADKMSMAASLELRTPFLDYRLVEWAASAPARAKVGPGQDGRWQTKAILRQYAARRLPATIIDRPKQGFPVPVYDWLAGDLKAWSFETSCDDDSFKGLFDRQAVEAIVRAGTEAEAGIMDRHRLWNLLVFSLWLKEWS
jgi:asparagine synthase (glutamine-hydrolysing)